MKIAHEAPISIMEKVRRLTDYDYFLAHLFEDNNKYLRQMEDSTKQEREVYLDNSCFELGVPYSINKLMHWTKCFEVDRVFIPDYLEDLKKTKDSLDECFDKYPHTTLVNGVGVLQGKSEEEVFECYRNFAEVGVKMIGISFDYSFYQSHGTGFEKTKWENFCLGRVKLFRSLREQSFFDPTIKIHLLGLSLPWEMILYTQEEKSFIYSIDTSCPVVHGLMGVEISVHQIEKESTKLHTLINSKVSAKQWELIEKNIHFFKKICND